MPHCMLGRGAQLVTKLVVRARFWRTMLWYGLRQTGTLRVGNRLLHKIHVTYYVCQRSWGQSWTLDLCLSASWQSICHIFYRTYNANSTPPQPFALNKRTCTWKNTHKIFEQFYCFLVSPYQKIVGKHTPHPLSCLCLYIEVSGGRAGGRAGCPVQSSPVHPIGYNVVYCTPNKKVQYWC